MDNQPCSISLQDIGLEKNVDMKDAMITTLPTESEEEFFLLMSLALDGLLDAAEEATFDRYLMSDPALAAEWQAWQGMHRQMVAAPHAIPTANFVDRFEVNLAQQERRQLLWQGMWIALITLVLWIGAAAGILSVGTYLFVNQSALLADWLQQVIYFWAALASWIDSLGTALNAFAGTPQAAGLGIGYLLLTVGLLTSWFSYLRRSTQLIEVAAEAPSPFSVA